ncbi:MAG: DUF975 family protein [Clostridiales bacterium]|jgi:uncharacterized membrane protein|nr:DUF975 family protein [Clostridiales bacterium]
MNKKDLKLAARKSLKGKWRNSSVVFLVRMVIITICLFIMRNTKYQFLGIISSFLIPSPLSIGLYGYYLSISRGKFSRDMQLFEPFIFFWNSVTLVFFRFIKIFFHSLLFIVPGIIVRYELSMAYFIINDNPGLKAKNALKASKILMKKHKYELFLIEMSFIHLFLLSIATLGLFWPFFKSYLLVTRAIFYDTIKNEIILVSDIKNKSKNNYKILHKKNKNYHDYNN